MHAVPPGNHSGSRDPGYLYIGTARYPGYDGPMKFQVASCFALILTSGLSSAAPVPEALDLVERSIAYHDPEGAWSSRPIEFVAEVRLAERLAAERGYETRTDRFVVDNAAGLFRCTTEVADDRIEISIDGDVYQTRVNGRSDVSDEVRQKHRLADDQLARRRNYFVFMYGIPMKLRDPGTRLNPEVVRTEFEGRDVYALRVTYSPEVGSDIWYFYFNPETYALVGCRFFHDEAANDGEFIVFDGEVRGPHGMRLPKLRRWHMNRDREFIASDDVVSIEAG